MKRSRWERRGLPLSISISRTSWLSPAKSCVSIQNITQDVRRVLTDYNWGIHKETASGWRRITALHLMHIQPKCQTRGSKALRINKQTATHQGHKCHLSYKSESIHTTRLHVCHMNSSIHWCIERKESFDILGNIHSYFRVWWRGSMPHRQKMVNLVYFFINSASYLYLYLCNSIY